MIHPITLVGLMGSGKTTLAAALGEYFGWPVYDTDSWVEARENKPISEIVQVHGWDYFRFQEAEFCQSFAEIGPSIIATGGGFILTESNLHWLLHKTVSVYLHVDPEVALSRITQSSQGASLSRPLLDGHSRKEQEAILYELYTQRDPLYRSVQYTIDGNAPLDQVLHELIEIASISEVE